MRFETKLLSSLEKVFPDKAGGEPIEYATALQNEPFSFQLAYRCVDSINEPEPFYVRVETDLDTRLISEYAVGYVPVVRADFLHSDGYFERKTPGLYPDMLIKRTTNAPIDFDDNTWKKYTEHDQREMLSAVRDSYQSIWFTVNESGKVIKPGSYKIKICLFASKDNVCESEETLTLDIIPAQLQKQTLYYTSWFHNDCLADTYGVEVFSDEYFEIMRSFVTEAAKTGMNMILLPAFTPALDTTVGGERKTVQLVAVTKCKGEYTFDFSLMKKYIEICRGCGIENFEHSHFFTQWGAKHAPKVMATVDGEYKRIFGWDTDSLSEEYTSFLKNYIEVLKGFLKEMKLEKNILFHISDEPSAEWIEYYDNAQKTVGNLLKDYMCGDALSGYEYYENGCVKIPIVIVDSPDMEKFVNRCDNYWVYYTGGQLKSGCSNRIIPTTSARNRVLGLQMYVGGAKGFLHWGYNYYYDVLSHGIFNPATNPCGYNKLAGTSYLVYPGLNRQAIPSLRMKVLYEGFNDYRALTVLESLIGREAVLAFIKETLGNIGYNYCPTGETLFAFRQELNNMILKNI